MLEDDTNDPDDDGEEYRPPANVFFENEELIRALNDERREQGDDEVAVRLFSALLGATLMALVPEHVDISIDERGRADRDMEVSFVLVRHPNVEGDIVPMFTDEGSLASFAPDGGRYVALAVRDMFPLLCSAGDPPHVVINPGGEEALLLSPRMVADVVEAVRSDVDVEVVASSGEPVMVGLPAEPMTPELEGQVRAVLDQHPDIVRCLQLQWFVPGRHELPSIVLAMELEADLDADERRAALSALWRELSPILRQLERTVEMVDLDAQRQLFGQLVDEADPLYRRAA